MLSDLSFKAKLQLLLSSALAALLLVALLAIVATSLLRADSDRFELYSVAMAAQQDSDMMHDAIRADVLDLLNSTNGEAISAEEKKRLEDARAEHVADFQKSQALLAQLPLDDDVKAAAKAADAELRKYFEMAEAISAAAYKNNGLGQMQYPVFYKQFEALEKRMETLTELLQSKREAAKAQLATDFNRLGWAQVVVAVFGFFGALLIGIKVYRSVIADLGGEPADAKQLANEISRGNLDNMIRLQPGDSSSLLVALANMQTQLAERQKEAIANARIRAALDVSATNVMIADAANVVIYSNQAMRRTLHDSEVDIRKDMPAFRAGALEGGNVDQLYSNAVLSQAMLRQLDKMYETQIQMGGRTIHLMVTPIVDVKAGRLGTVMEWQDQTEMLAKLEIERRKAAENARIKAALDNVSTNVMIADNDRNIIYMNPAVMQMLRHAEADIRKTFPQFDSAKLLGANMDGFHRNPAHQRDLLASLKGTYKSEITLSGHTFGLTANPVYGEDGLRLGTVVQWLDRTDEVAAEKEVGGIIGAAANGDFSQRILLDGKNGFFRVVSENINRLVETAADGLEEVASVLDRLSQGDLTYRIEKDYQGIFGRLKDSANTTVSSLSELVTQINESADTIATAAKEIASGNQNLSHRTEQQAANLEETASSMEELTSTVKQNAENSREANKLAGEASTVAQRGGEVVGQVVSTMSDISASAKKIADIIGVIDGIAFQTNILALNAAVEAARAGEQGRGFAVVASEVRSLAQRSATAAKEIKTLINESVGRVEEGTKQVDNAGKTMETVVESIKRVAALMSDVSEASVEQSSGIEQVNRAVAEMDESTQQNAALVEQAAAAAESMEQQVGVLSSSVSVFRLDGASRRSSPSKAVVVAAPRKVATTTARPAAALARPAKPASSDQEEWEEF